jgi:hypothetical protein
MYWHLSLLHMSGWLVGCKHGSETADTYLMCFDFHRNLEVHTRCKSIHSIRDRIDKEVPGNWEPVSEADEAVIVSDNSDNPVFSDSVACRFDGILNKSLRIISSEHKIEGPIILSIIDSLIFSICSMKKGDALVVEHSKRAPCNSWVGRSVGWHIEDDSRYENAEES